MNVSRSLRERLIASGPARKGAEVLFRAACRRHLARLDAPARARCQTRTLLGLIHRARHTPFGVAHDFRRIRTVADFRRLVPLAGRADLRRHADEPAPPSVRAAHAAAWRAGLWTALALAAQARPKARVLDGNLVLLGDEADCGTAGLSPLADRVPGLLRPYTLTAPDDDLSVAAVADRASLLPVRCLVGPLEALAGLLERVRQYRNRDCVADVWPGLSAVLFTRTATANPAGRTRLLNLLGPDVLLLEVVSWPEGPVAVEDPRLGSLRLLCDHGVYYEFVPRDASGSDEAMRLGVEEVEAGVPCELVLTAPGGLWAYRTGRPVCLERRGPAVVRFLRGPVALPVVAGDEAREHSANGMLSRADGAPTPLAAPHPRNGGTPAGPPENFAHTPWSALADRG